VGWAQVTIAPDTNVLVRALVSDDPAQARVARRALRDATAIVLSLSCLCELAWVLSSAYRKSAVDVARAIRSLVDSDKIDADRQAIEMGLAMLEAGGDFADGVIAYEGAWRGAEQFVSFDRQAVALLKKQGVAAVQL
jgi:predicted nucleic-acid-binding protein